MGDNMKYYENKELYSNIFGKIETKYKMDPDLLPGNIETIAGNIRVKIGRGEMTQQEREIEFKIKLKEEKERIRSQYDKK